VCSCSARSAAGFCGSPQAIPLRRGAQSLIRALLFCALLGLAAVRLVVPAVAAPPTVDKVSVGQRAAALEFLSAVASGDPQAMAAAIHPDDLQALRLRLMGLMREEVQRGDGTIRSRLFGPGMPLEDIERLTPTAFFATLAYKLYWAGREYSDVEGLVAVADQGGRMQVVVRGRQPRDHGKAQVVNVVTLKRYGKDWKAALPGETEAQIDDLIEGRHIAVARLPLGATAVASTGTAAALPAIIDLLDSAEKSLNQGRCDEYYGRQMSPNFRRVTGKKALEALQASCQNSMGTRQLLLSTLHIVRGLQPRYENESQRAVYDLSGQGLPYQTFSLEQVDRRWYVAE
jgi:hypothetical protein